MEGTGLNWIELDWLYQYNTYSDHVEDVRGVARGDSVGYRARVAWALTCRGLTGRLMFSRRKVVKVEVEEVEVEVEEVEAVRRSRCQ